LISIGEFLLDVVIGSSMGNVLSIDFVGLTPPGEHLLDTEDSGGDTSSFSGEIGWLNLADGVCKIDFSNDSTGDDILAGDLSSEEIIKKDLSSEVLKEVSIASSSASLEDTS